MESPFEYVQNFSDKPIPEPYKFDPTEQRTLFDLQRRRHLEAWDPAYNRAPLSEEERELLEMMEARIRRGTLIVHAGVEMRFAPGQIYQVPRGQAAKIVAKLPERLTVVSWQDAMAAGSVATPRFQTVEDAKELLSIISAGMDPSGQKGVIVSICDDVAAWGDVPRN